MSLLAIRVRPGVPANGDLEAVPVSGLLRRLWRDDCGALLAAEWVLIATLMVLGLVPALIAIRQGVLSELTEMANATRSLDQSFGFTGQRIGCNDDNVGGATLDRNGNPTGRLDPVIEQAIRIGAIDGRDVRLVNDRNDRGIRPAANDRGRTGDVRNVGLLQGGTQAFSAGSAFIESRHFGEDRPITLKSVPPTPTDPNQPPCD